VIRGLLNGGATWVQTAALLRDRFANKDAPKPLRWTLETWKEHADAMAYLNIGSTFSPFYFAEACDCEIREMPELPPKYPASADCKTIPAAWPVADAS